MRVASKPHRPLIILMLATLLLGDCLLTRTKSADAILPFSTDGCSLFPDRALIGKADWCECCVVHDLAYWRGGTADDRLQADKALRACVERATGNKAFAELMFGGVRAGGGPYFYTTYRWAYGWPQGHGYAPLSTTEQAQASAEEQEYRAAHPTLSCPNLEVAADNMRDKLAVTAYKKEARVAAE